MEPELPTISRRATLADLLDRVLDKGIFLRADVIISLAGIPLIGASLSVAVAGTETLVKYGLLADWDESIRGGSGGMAAVVCRHAPTSDRGTWRQTTAAMPPEPQ